jgi:small subunit ribosomal protein MRP21
MLTRTAAANPSRCIALALALPIRSKPASIQVVRFHASRSCLEDNGNPTSRPAIRRNPLIGGGARSPPAQQQPSPSPIASPNNPLDSNIEDSPYDAASPPPPPPPPAEQPGRTGQAAQSRTARSDAERLEHQYTYDAASTSSSSSSSSSNNPLNPLELDISSIIANKASAFAREFGQVDPAKQPKVQPSAATGRTVFVQATRGSASATTAPTPVVALKRLETLLRQQKVKSKASSQRFHERRALKKKRLLRMRWRARFKTGFQAACDRVYELKRQGW